MSRADRSPRWMVLGHLGHPDPSVWNQPLVNRAASRRNWWLLDGLMPVSGVVVSNRHLRLAHVSGPDDHGLMTTDRIPIHHVSVVLFEGFELLDVFGPVELFSLASGFEVDYVGARRGPVASSQGAQVVAQRAYAEVGEADIILVPGGMGTRRLVEDDGFLTWLDEVALRSRLVASVCTGSAVLAAAGLLEGCRATTNKQSYTWATGFGRDVDWQPAARWVHDRSRWTSSGVAAGMDMAAALIADQVSPEAAEAAVRQAELEIHRDSTWDPFAVAAGLVEERGESSLTSTD